MTTNNVNKIKIRMYRGGTGDFFLLQLKKDDTVSFQMMIDCGCIDGSKAYFTERLNDLKKVIGNDTIDLLVVTHEHADHINGFKLGNESFKDIRFKKVWFAWTENDEDSYANELRKNFSELNKAVNIAVDKLNTLNNDKYFKTLYQHENDKELMLEGKSNYIDSLNSLNNLNFTSLLGTKEGSVKPTMVELFKDWGIIKKDTEVEFLEPGDVKSKIEGATGINFYVMGPPKNKKFLNLEHQYGENYQKRENESTKDFALIEALSNMEKSSDVVKHLPFETEYEMPDASETKAMKAYYDSTQNEWRKIDHDWLFSIGSLAMRYEKSINNTSLALAIQFENSEKVLLFPGDAELGNWLSWHENLTWPVMIEGQIKRKNAEYFLNKTVFYKVGHHMSLNGSAKGKGIEMMTSDDLTVMATLDFRKIKSLWLRTMPNDFLGAELINKSKGKMYFQGERGEIIPKIKTDRVQIKKEYEAQLNKLNKPFDNKTYIDCEIEG